MMKILIILLLVASASTSHGKFLNFLKPSPIVQTQQGLVEGRYVQNGTAAFKGIPFAAPPVGKLRWKAPQPPKKYQGVYKAFKSGPVSLQPSLITGEIIGSEDCLYLNIWVPENPTGMPLPVMFWIHGGAFILGSAHQKIGLINLYDGAVLAEKSRAIVVTANYRLGPMGYFAHPDLVKEDPLGSTGNYAGLDQIAGLKWVKDNIEFFGGDPSRIIPFGESAGGSSVLTLLASPLAKDLFPRVVVQSGPLFEIPLSRAFDQGERIASAYSPFGKKISMNKLRLVSGAQIVRDFPLVTTPNLEPTQYGPVVDGVFLKYPVIETILRNEHNSVDVEIGSNGDEMTVLAPFFLKGVSRSLSMETYRDYLKLYLEDDLVEPAMEYYNESRYGSYKNALFALFEDFGFHSPVDQVISALLNVKNPKAVYRYLFNQKMQIVKAGHATELPYYFQNKFLLFLMNYKPLLPHLAPGDLLRQLKLSESMIRYRSNFVHYGNPNGPEGSLREEVYWPEAHGGKLMEFKSEGHNVAIGFRDHAMDFWRGQISPRIQSRCGEALKILPP